MENSQLRPPRTAELEAKIRARLEQATAEAMSDPDSQELLANLNRYALKSEEERKRREGQQVQ